MTEQGQLAERVSSDQRSQDHRVPRVGMLFLDLKGACSHDVEGVGTVTLAEDGLTRANGDQSDPAGEVGEDILGELVEGGEGIDQLCRFDAPRGLEPEPDAPRQCAEPLRGGAPG